MKHPFWDRVIIVITTLILLALALLVLGLLTGFFTQSMGLDIQDFRHEAMPVKVGIGAGALALFVLAILNFMIVLPPRKKKESAYTIQQAENGELKISLKALEHLVQKCIEQHPELSSVVSTISSNEESVTVELHVTLSADINIPMAVTALQKEIKQYIEATSGVHVEEVRVVVDSTSVLPDSAQGSPFLIPEMMQVKQVAAPAAEGTPQPADDSHMYTFQEEEATPAAKPFIPPAPPVNAYGDMADDRYPEDDTSDAAQSEIPEDSASDADFAERLSQQQTPDTDMWMMGTQPSLPSESEEDET